MSSRAVLPPLLPVENPRSSLDGVVQGLPSQGHRSNGSHSALVEDDSGASSSDSGSDSEDGGLTCFGRCQKDEEDPTRVAPRAEPDKKAIVAQDILTKSFRLHSGAESVQTEITCIRTCSARDHQIYLHKDCIVEMIEKNISQVILLPPDDPAVREAFEGEYDADAGEFPVALRIPKDDTKDKKEKEDKKKKKLKFPKYAYFKGRANYKIRGNAVELQGIHLAWELQRTTPQEPRMGATPSAREPKRNMTISKMIRVQRAVTGHGSHGDPEPLSLLCPADIKDGPQDPYYQVFINKKSGTRSPLLAAAVRTMFEAASVWMFLVYLGSVPDTYTRQAQRPWKLDSDNRFSIPNFLTNQYIWRAPGFDHIFALYIWTFLIALAAKLLLCLIWHILPDKLDRRMILRHCLAALYPLTITVPLNLYLLYYFGALTNCKQCKDWNCGGYKNEPRLRLQAETFQDAGGCEVTALEELFSDKYRQYVITETKIHREHFLCDRSSNWILENIFGAALDFSKREGTCSVNFDDSDAAKDRELLNRFEETCSERAAAELLLQTVQSDDYPTGKDLPFWMFARDVPGGLGNCSLTGQEQNFSRYVYYDRYAEDSAVGAVCVCNSPGGYRDCYLGEEGSVNWCTHFTGLKTRHGRDLDFEGVSAGMDAFSLFQFIALPLYAVLSMSAWEDVPMGALDKSDERVITKMKLDILDCFLFFFRFVIKNQENTKISSLENLGYLTHFGATWRNASVNLWVLAWVTTYLFATLDIFFHMVDKDPDKTQKTYKNVKDITSDLVELVETGGDKKDIESLANTARKKQILIYEKEVQKIIKRGMSVWVVDRGLDTQNAWPWQWKKMTIVWSTPKVKEAEFTHDLTFTLYMTGGWPWSRKPPEQAWRCSGPKEFFKCDEDEQEAPWLVKTQIRYTEILTRLVPTTGYLPLDPRYLGWAYCCGWQPKFEWKKIKEEDLQIRERYPGPSEVYYDKSRFDWFERNMEYFNSLRSLVFLEVPFMAARLYELFFLGGLSDMFSVLLVMKNVMFTLFDIVYIVFCGNARHACGPCQIRPVELMAKCISNTKIGRAIKLSVLMPIRILLECLSCMSRESTEDKLQECEQQIHMCVLHNAKSEQQSEALTHQRRLLKDKCRQHEEMLELLDVKNLVKVKHKVKAKDFHA